MQILLKFDLTTLASMKNILPIFLFLPFLARAQSIHISTPATTICKGSSIVFTATDSTSITPHYQWKLNNTNTGTDTSIYTTNTLNNGDSVICLLINAAGDTVLATSNTINIMVDTPLNAGTITGYDTLCAGSTTTLTESIPGGIWSENSGAASVDSGIVTGIHGEEEGFPAFDSVFYTVTNSCGSSVASAQVVVKPLPDAWFYIGWPTPYDAQPGLCINTSADVNGDDGVDGIIYSLHGHLSCININVFVISAGLDKIVCISTNSCGVDTFRLPFVVYPAAVAGTITSHKTEICISDTILLSDTTTGLYSSLTWAGSNNNATVYSYDGTLIGTANGVDTITVTNWFCGHATTSITITVNPTPQINSTKQFCSGTSQTLASSVANTTWSSSDPAIAAIDQQGLLNAVQAGTTLISAAIGSCSTNIEVTVNPQPSAIYGADVICMGSQATMTNQIAGTWTSTDPAIATASPGSGIVQGISKGFTTISFSAGGCTTVKQITVEDCDKELSIFPNPVQNELTIQADTAAYNYCTVINSIGQVLFRQHISQPLNQIDVQYFSPGIYLLRLTGDHATSNTKFVKE